MSSNQTTIAKLKEVSQKYSDIHDRIRDAVATLNPVELVTPKNIGAKKEAWIEQASHGSFTNPEFEYNEDLLRSTLALRPKLDELMAKLKIVPRNGDVAEQFILAHFESVLSDGIETTALAESILNKQDDKSVDITTNKYGLPSKKDIEDAYEIVNNNREKDRFTHEIKQNRHFLSTHRKTMTEKCLGAREIKEIFEWAMNGYNEAANWPIVIDKTATSIDVRDKSSANRPQIVIPEKRKVSGLKLAELVGHEIECHWRSSINTANIGILKCDDELVYEGLAALKDKTFNRRYCEIFELNSAHYIIAINEAIQGGSFAKVAALIYNSLPISLGGEDRVNKAWSYTYRVFRGITDTSNPHCYAFPKDRAYFEGYRYASELEEQGKATYLSYSTLGLANFTQFMKIVDIKDVEENAILDKNIQEKSLEKILRCINYIGY